MATPSPLYFAMQPLQQVIFDKDTGAALAAGIVTYYSDPAFTVRKDIYEQSNQPDGSYIYTNIGSQVILSSIGSFVDNNGQNFIPFAYPWSIAPGVQGAPGEFEPYFITVYSSGLILQFTVTGWPANDFSGSVFTEATPLTINQITDPQFPVVLFTADPTSGVYSYTNSGTTTVQVAPGWFLTATTSSGTGVVTLKQESISSDEFSDPPYALDITLATGTSAFLYQRIINSPRLLVNAPAVASYFLAKSLIGSITNLILTYVPSSGTSIVLANGETTANGAFGEITGNVVIPEPVSTSGGTGYVDIQLTIPDGSSIAVTSFQVVGVTNETEFPSFSEQSTPIQESLLAYYYQPKLAYKPIPSYTIGWDFAFNPCQELGTSVAAAALGANKSRYIADQTIAFEATSNTLSYAFTNLSGLTVTATGAGSQFALVQYLDATTATELLEGRMSVEVNCGYNGTITGYVNLYYTQDVTLPDVTNATKASLVSALTAGVPTTANGTWIQVPRSGLGAAVFQPTNTISPFTFSGWDATAIGSSATPTFFAIVVSFSSLAIATSMSIRYCTLARGDFATAPPPLNKAQTLQALQYYYESSYASGVVPGTASSTANQVVALQAATAIGGFLWMSTVGWGLQFQTIKIATPSVTFYAPVSGASGNVTGYIYAAATVNATQAQIGSPTNITIAQFASSALSTKALSRIAQSSDALLLTATVNATNPYGLITYHYTADSRLGTY